MKFFICFLIITLAICSASSKTYVASKLFRGNWYKAYHYCFSHGMRLATVRSKEETDQITKAINDLGIHQDFGYFWIGASNMDNENYFYWLGHEEPMTYTNWYSTEPSNKDGIENCVEIRTRLLSQWNDDVCQSKKFFVCEKE